MNESEKILVGKISSAYGIKGWVNVYSHTDPIDKIFAYSPWFLKKGSKSQTLTLSEAKRHNKGLVVLPEGFDDRSQAEALNGYEIWIEKSLLSELKDGEFYWHQLEGLKVFNEKQLLLGEVSHLMETGANDVLVVSASSESIDDKERLIPYVENEVIVNIDLEAGSMRVKWDADY